MLPAMIEVGQKAVRSGAHRFTKCPGHPGTADRAEAASISIRNDRLANWVNLHLVLGGNFENYTVFYSNDE